MPSSSATRDGGQWTMSRLLLSHPFRFPWESARTGIDVTPDCCPEVRLYQMHITGDIAFAARQYISATGDKKWLQSEGGGDLIYETAHFWQSRAVWNASRNQFDILGTIINDLKHERTY
jgi:protein-glucosylgalactosylhydroxylysine glucosidase